MILKICTTLQKVIFTYFKQNFLGYYKLNLNNIELPSNRKFGTFFTFIFGLCACYSFYINAIIFTYAFIGISITFFLVSMLKSDILLPLNKLWMRFGLLLGMIVSPIVLGLIFFGIFTPTALLMQLFRRDELRIRFKNKKSYWIARHQPIDPVSFKRQF